MERWYTWVASSISPFPEDSVMQVVPTECLIHRGGGAAPDEQYSKSPTTFAKCTLLLMITSYVLWYALPTVPLALTGCLTRPTGRRNAASRAYMTMSAFKHRLRSGLSLC